MLFRELTIEDYDDFILLMEEFRPIGLHVSKEMFKEVYNNISKNSIIYVGILDSKIVCSAKLLIEQKFIHKLSKYGYVEDVIVNNKYRRQGLGYKIVKHIVDYCKKNSFYKITLTCNNNLIPFYEKNNFEVYDIHMSQLL